MYKKKLEIHNLAVSFTDGIRKTRTATVEKDIVVPLSAESSSLKYSRIIQISYELRVIAELFGLYRNLEIVIPVTIGTIPLIFQDIRNYTPVETTPAAVSPVTSVTSCFMPQMLDLRKCSEKMVNRERSKKT